MNIFIMDPWLNKEYVLDVFESLIWTERYIGCGNFELYTPITKDTMDIANFIRGKKDYSGLAYGHHDSFALSQETGTAMFIEDLQITTDAETGNHLTMSGRGLETILERRIVYKSMVLSGNIQDCLEKLVNDAIISPDDLDRQISNFTFKRSVNQYLNNLSVTIQCNIGDNLYDIFLKVCEVNQIGFDVNVDLENKRFVLSLTYGEDRSRLQYENQLVIFSPKYENMINSDYLESGKSYKNANLVVGDDQYGLDNVIITTVNGAFGLRRKEMYTDASDIDLKDQYKVIEDDKETLENYKQNLSDYQTSLTNVQTEQNEKTIEHNKKVEGYNQTKKSYQNRKAALDERIAYYNNLKEQYKDGLDSSQKKAYEDREKYKANVEKYDKLIQKDNDKINEWNDALQNDMTMDYSDLVNYEESIIAYEEEKKDYQNTKTKWENKQKAEEEKLPNFEKKLKMYEDMISKYKDIVSNDQKSLKQVNDESAKELAEYNKNMEGYNKLINSYNEAISNTQSSISSQEAQIYWDTYELNELYNKILHERGTNELSENMYTRAFTSEIDPLKMFVYGKDFFLGDIVEVINEYGMSDQVRVSEIVRSEDVNGFNMYPTFQIIEYHDIP